MKVIIYASAPVSKVVGITEASVEIHVVVVVFYRMLTLIVVYCVLAIGRFFVVVMFSADLYSAEVDIGSQINNAKSIKLLK